MFRFLFFELKWWFRFTEIKKIHLGMKANPQIGKDL